MRYIIAIPPASEFVIEQSSISAAIFQVFHENNVGEPSLDGIMDWKWTANLKNHPLDLSIGNGVKARTPLMKLWEERGSRNIWLNLPK